MPYKIDMMIHYLPYILLSSLLALTILHVQSRTDLRLRQWEDWVLDGMSLIFFFIVLPFVQIGVVYQLYARLIPAWHALFDGGWVISMLWFAAMDYAWYWNHRLLHARTPLWNLHSVHHMSQRLDLFASQRNTIWSFGVMTYFWLTPLFLFLTNNPTPFLILSSIAILINFWGHTRLVLPRKSVLWRLLSLAIIQPEDHFWHHSESNPGCNFATIFNFWDKLHGTWYQPGVEPPHLGFNLKMSIWRKLFFPV
jgi:sterol desaturase/sphingolipid hydroxylase (fatty acid hydroxylase superfamily)